MTRVLPPLTLLAAALVLTGCSTGDPTGTETAVPTSDAAAATGELITGDGYSYHVPEGWGVPDQAPSGPDTIAIDLDDTDGFTDNVNVVLSPAGEITPEQVEAAGPPELEGSGASDVEIRPRIAVAGEESAHLSGLFTSNGATYQIDQYYPTHDDQTYVVTFSFSQEVPEGDREALAESVLAGWAWA